MICERTPGNRGAFLFERFSRIYPQLCVKKISISLNKLLMSEIITNCSRDVIINHLRISGNM